MAPFDNLTGLVYDLKLFERPNRTAFLSMWGIDLL
jgi:hypothetical protein